jgi:hypothetical protein
MTTRAAHGSAAPADTTTQAEPRPRLPVSLPKRLTLCWVDSERMRGPRQQNTAELCGLPRAYLPASCFELLQLIHSLRSQALNGLAIPICANQPPTATSTVCLPVSSSLLLFPTMRRQAALRALAFKWTRILHPLLGRTPTLRRGSLLDRYSEPKEAAAKAIA